MNVDMLYAAIRSRNVVQFYYRRDKAPGTRTVEPYMVAYNAKGRLALLAWHLGGASESKEGQGWCEYVVSGVTNVAILNLNFSGSRPDYNPTGGTQFPNVRCAIPSLPEFCHSTL